VKEETLELSKIENHQDKSIIAYIDKIYKESFNKFIYFCWIAKSIVLVVGKSAKTMGQADSLELEHNIQLNTFLHLHCNNR
jgi:hypothetical protein